MFLLPLQGANPIIYLLARAFASVLHLVGAGGEHGQCDERMAYPFIPVVHILSFFMIQIVIDFTWPVHQFATLSME